MRLVDLTPDLLATFLANPIRPADEQEWMDGLGKSVREALPDNLVGAQRQRCVLDDAGVPIVVFYARADDGIATLAMVGADRDQTLAMRIYLEFSKSEWPEVIRMAPILQAFPSANNTLHHKWLEHVGFKKVRTIKLRGSQFYRYVRRRGPDDVL